MLFLPEDWDHTTKGIARICKDGVDSICSIVRDLEDHGYIIRERVWNEKGQLATVEYTILVQPMKGSLKWHSQDRKKLNGKSSLGKPEQENLAQLNANKSNTDLSSTDGSNPIEPQAADGDGTDGIMANREADKQLVMENIEYAYPFRIGALTGSALTNLWS